MQNTWKQIDVWSWSLFVCATLLALIRLLQPGLIQANIIYLVLAIATASMAIAIYNHHEDNN